jgi:hypothetical protein
MSAASTRSPLPDTATPASAYTQQQRLIKQYHALLAGFDEERIEALMHAVWRPAGGALSEAQMYGTPPAKDTPEKPGSAGEEGFLNRIEDHVPEHVWLMNEQQRADFADLLAAGPDGLAHLVRHTLALGQSLKRRETDPRLKKYKADASLADWETDPRQWHNDDARCRLVGLDTLHKQNYATALSGARLNSHNARRQREGLPPVVVSMELSPRQWWSWSRLRRSSRRPPRSRRAGSGSRGTGSSSRCGRSCGPPWNESTFVAWPKTCPKRFQKTQGLP